MYVCICVNVYVYICIYVYKNMCVYVCMYTYYVYERIYVSVFVSVCLL